MMTGARDCVAAGPAVYLWHTRDAADPFRSRAWRRKALKLDRQTMACAHGDLVWAVPRRQISSGRSGALRWSVVC